jgi:excisionase family DNA binding protein
MATGYLSKRAAAQWLDVSGKTIDRLRAAGELEAIKLTDGPGGRVRISASSLRAYAERRQQRTAASEEPAERFPIPALDALRAEKARGRAATAGGQEAAA